MGEAVQKFDPAKLAYGVVRLAQSVTDPDDLLEMLHLDGDCPDPDALTRDQLRQIITFAHAQRDLDVSASAPTSIDIMSKKIDRNLNEQIDALTKENELLRRIGGQDPEKVFKVDSTGEVLTPAEARHKITLNLQQMLEFKKHLSEERKSANGAGNPNTALNLNVDLGSIVSSTLGNIKAAQEAKIIDA